MLHLSARIHPANDIVSESESDFNPNLTRRKMKDPLDVLLVVLNTMNFVLHVFGIFLLSKLGRKKTQHVYIMNLSAAELMKNFLIILTCIPEMFPLSESGLDVYKRIHVYLGIIYDYGIMCAYVLTMFYITLDRYFLIVMGNTYKMYWNVSKSNFLVLFTWLLGATISVVILFVYNYTNGKAVLRYIIYTEDREALLVSYSRPFIDILFIILATAIYYKIFKMYSKQE